MSDERCLVCQGAPAGMYFSVPPGDRLQKKANGHPIWYVLCASCEGADIAVVDAALRRREEGGADGTAGEP